MLQLGVEGVQELTGLAMKEEVTATLLASDAPHPIAKTCWSSDGAIAVIISDSDPL
jgi:hypothetical protein